MSTASPTSRSITSWAKVRTHELFMILMDDMPTPLSVVVVGGGETGKLAAERWAKWIDDPNDIEATLALCIPS